MSAARRLWVGTAGWSYPDWKGVVYPGRPGRGFDALRFLAAYVDLIEINSTFYRPPSASTAARWAETVADLERFSFTAKLYRGFTHVQADRLDAGEVAAFRQGLAPLHEAGRLDAVLAQFPFYFDASPRNLDHLWRLRDLFPDYDLVVEVRHRSFIANTVMERLRDARLSFCNIDQPLARTSIEPGPRVTGPIGYLRLHGRNADAWFSKGAGRDEKYDYLYEPDELTRFATLIATLEQRAERVFVVANNHFRGKGLVNALELRHLTGRVPLEVPEELLRSYPRLAAVQR